MKINKNYLNLLNTKLQELKNDIDNIRYSLNEALNQGDLRENAAFDITRNLLESKIEMYKNLLKFNSSCIHSNEDIVKIGDMVRTNKNFSFVITFDEFSKTDNLLKVMYTTKIALSILNKTIGDSFVFQDIEYIITSITKYV